MGKHITQHPKPPTAQHSTPQSFRRAPRELRLAAAPHHHETVLHGVSSALKRSKLKIGSAVSAECYRFCTILKSKSRESGPSVYPWCVNGELVVNGAVTRDRKVTWNTYSPSKVRGSLLALENTRQRFCKIGTKTHKNVKNLGLNRRRGGR